MSLFSIRSSSFKFIYFYYQHGRSFGKSFVIIYANNTSDTVKKNIVTPVTDEVMIKEKLSIVSRVLVIYSSKLDIDDSLRLHE
jgi:hypothetical protein